MANEGGGRIDSDCSASSERRTFVGVSPVSSSLVRYLEDGMAGYILVKRTSSMLPRRLFDETRYRFEFTEYTGHKNALCTAHLSRNTQCWDMV